MKGKILIIITMLVVACLVLPSVTAQNMVIQDTNEIDKEILQQVDKLKNFLGSLDYEPRPTIETVHQIFLLVYEIFAIAIGHNVVSWLLARCCCCWFIVPTVVLMNIPSISINSSFLEYFNQYMKQFNVSYLKFKFGALYIFAIPFVYCFAFLCALSDTIATGSITFNGGWEQLTMDWAYIIFMGIDYAEQKRLDAVYNNPDNSTIDIIRLFYYKTGLSSLIFLAMVGRLLKKTIPFFLPNSF